MKEVLKIAKNYETGEVITKKAFKPENIIGKMTISVFNENGELKEEVISNNIIPMPQLLENFNFNNIQLMSLLLGNRTYSLNSQRSAWTKIELHNTDGHTENQDDLILKGEIIGHCPKYNQNAGDDITRGVYNPTESTKAAFDGDFLHEHLVYDFGTSQGNGTFDAVYWRRYYGDFFITAIHAVTPNEFDIPTTSFSNVRVIGDGKINKPTIRKNSKLLTSGVGKYFNTGYGEWINDTEKSFVDEKFVFDNGNKYLNVVDVELKQSQGNCANLKHRFKFEVCNSLDKSVISESAEFDMYDFMSEDWKSKWISKSNSSNYPNNARCTPLIVTNDGKLIVVIGTSCNSSSSYSPRISVEVPTSRFDDTYKAKSLRVHACIGVYDLNTHAWELYPDITNPRSGGISNINQDILTSIIYTPTEGGNSSISAEVILEKECFFIISKGASSVAAISHNKNYKNFDFISNLTTDCMALTCTNSNYNPCVQNVIRALNDTLICGCTSSSYQRTSYGRFTHGYNAHTLLPKSVTKTSSDTMKIQYDYYIQYPYYIADEDGNFVAQLSEAGEHTASLALENNI